MADANYVTHKEIQVQMIEIMLLCSKAYEKKDGVTPTRHMGMSSNPFQERSNILLKSGTIITIDWNS